MNNGLILLTGLPPHEGHRQLILWASQFFINKLTVLVCGTANDILSVDLRRDAIAEECASMKNVTFVSLEHNLPDYPEQHNGTLEEFDKLWVDKIYEYVPDLDKDDYLFASDTYGARFAGNLGVKFAPFDPNREIVKVSATKIRREPFVNFGRIVPAMQRHLRMTVTMFGAESTGKSTMGRHLATRYNSIYVPEWARPYLEALPTPEITDSRMAMIIRGQFAVQNSTKTLNGNPFIVQDTDLLSTLGYFKLSGIGDPIDVKFCENLCRNTKSDLYIVMNGNIRFTPDPLRYGITKRESSDQFWIDLLEEFGCKYHYVKSINPIAQQEEVEYVVKNAFYAKNPVFGYERI